MFTVHKFLRCFALYVVVVNVVQDRRDVMAVIGALTAAVLLQGVVVFWDKYITQAVVARSIGSFRHPNTLAMYLDLILPILVALLMVGRGLSSELQSWMAAAVVAGFISVLFTKSRAAMLLLPTSLAAVAVVLMLLRPAPRKFLFLGIGTVVVALIVAVALPRLIARFESAPKESAETREYFNEAAHAMARDNLFGVGVNLYSYALANTDYYWYVYPDRVDVPDPEAFRESDRGQSRLGTAHHIYWLYAAEMGYIGLAVFLLHCGVFYVRNLILFFREKDEVFKAIYLGMLVGVSFFHVHGLLEWIFRQTEVLYLYFILMGMMVAMARIRKQENAGSRPAAARPRPSARQQPRVLGRRTLQEVPA